MKPAFVIVVSLWAGLASAAQPADAPASAASAPEAAASNPLRATFPWTHRHEMTQPGPQKKPPPVRWNEPASAPLVSIPLPGASRLPAQ